VGTAPWKEPLVALCDRRDSYHEACRNQASGLPGSQFTCLPRLIARQPNSQEFRELERYLNYCDSGCHHFVGKALGQFNLGIAQKIVFAK
jgi:hypothetical protein